MKIQIEPKSRGIRFGRSADGSALLPRVNGNLFFSTPLKVSMKILRLFSETGEQVRDQGGGVGHHVKVSMKTLRL